MPKLAVPSGTSLRHFLAVAHAGAHPASSHGEKIAHQLAKALHEVGDDLCLLDADCIEGLCFLIRAMAGPFPTAELKDTIYGWVRRAALQR